MAYAGDDLQGPAPEGAQSGGNYTGIEGKFRNTDPGNLNNTQAEIDHSGQQRDHPFYGNVTGYTQRIIDRNQARGDAAAGRAAPTQNFSDYNSGIANGLRDRNNQSDALSLQRNAAYGNAPSRAEILGRQMADQGIASQMSMAASARGGALAQAAAMRAAQGGQAAYMQNATNNIAALRAQEMDAARNAYMQGATGMRQQDYGAAALGLNKTQLETQNELTQRQMNDAQQRFYEDAANHVYDEQLGADTGNAALAQQNRQFEQQRSDQIWQTGAGTAANVAAAALLFSDENTKFNATPLVPSLGGSAGSAMTGSAMPTGLAAQMAPPAQQQPTSPGMSPERKMAIVNYLGQAGGGLGRMLSDERTKTAAHPLLGPSAPTPRKASLSEAQTGMEKLKRAYG